MIDLTGASPAQKRQALAAHLGGPPVQLQTKGAGYDGLFTVELVDFASDGDPRGKPTRLVAREYPTSRMCVFPMQTVKGVEPGSWPVTDPRHPDYEAPTKVVRPAKAGPRRVGTGGVHGQQRVRCPGCWHDVRPGHPGDHAQGCPTGQHGTPNYE